MSLWQSLLNLFVDQRAHPLAGGDTPTGIDVTPENSLQVTAVFAAVRVLAEGVASLPLVTYKRKAGGGKDRATDHPLYSILHDLPNPEMTSVELRETLMGHLGGWGNAYAEIEFNNAGRVMGLWPLPPNRVRIRRVNRKLVYVVTMPVGPEQVLPFEQVMHIKGLGADGVMGYSPITLARQAVGLALATEQFGSTFFGNGARPGAILEHPGTLSDKAHSRLRDSWEMRHKGLENAHRVGILEEGMKLHEIGIPPEDAQFLETRKFQVSEIARLYRVPPHMIGDLEKATFSNIEQQSLDFVIHSLRPWLVRWEQAIYRDLLTPSERKLYFAEHLVEGLLRGDIQSRYGAYAIGRQNGWLNANEIREMENLNPYDGGDEYLIPLNMEPASQAGEEKTPADPSQPDPSADPQQTADPQALTLETRALQMEQRAQNLAKSRRKLAASYRRLLDEAAGRVIRREVADVKRAVEKFLTKRDAFQLSTWLRQFYQEHGAFWQRNFMPILLSYADAVGVDVAGELGGDAFDAEDIRAFIEQYLESLASREVGSSQLQLQALLDQAGTDGTDPEALLLTRLGEWEQKRAAKVALRESFNALNAFTKSFYVRSGITEVRWVTTGDNCPYCRSLNGKVIGIQKNFLDKDTNFQPDGADRPLNIRHNAGHPPIHGACDCLIIAERR